MNPTKNHWNHFRLIVVCLPSSDQYFSYIDVDSFIGGGHPSSSRPGGLLFINMLLIWALSSCLHD
jgi:hypothetical protein